MSVKHSGQDGRYRHPENLSRRDVLILGAGATAVSSTLFAWPAQATAETTRHGLSAFGDLGYPADFKHLKYVNPSAAKGGMFSQLAGGGTATFNSLNGFILKGDPAVDMELGVGGEIAADHHLRADEAEPGHAGTGRPAATGLVAREHVDPSP